MGDNVKLICADCNFSTCLRALLIQHVKRNHLNEFNKNDKITKRFKCTECELEFSLKGNLSRHIDHTHSNRWNDSEKTKCEVCGSAFLYRANMVRHFKAKHPDKVLPEKTFKHCCKVCTRRFNHLFNFKCHMRQVHGVEVSEPLKHKCPLCVELVPGKMKSVLNHLNNEHGVNIEKKLLYFENFKQFQDWKEKVENESKSHFVRVARRGDSRTEYRCHRSGVFISKSKGIRKLKIQGSKKIDGICPASIVLYRKNACYKALFISEHLGHDNDLKHLCISEKARLSIACKIACQVPFDIILEEYNKNISSSLELKKLITKKDLYNIRAAYKLNSYRNEDDSCLDWWVIEIASAHNSCITFYRSQEQKNQNGKDFVLILMNDRQKEILVNNSNCSICLDRTQCLNKHGYELITIYIVFEHKAFPCVFIITNKIGKMDYHYYFKLLRGQINFKITTELIITDLESSLYESWCEVMGKPKKRLLSPWHVDWAVRKNIAKIKDKEKQSSLYQSFLNLVKEKYIKSFETKLSLLLVPPKNNDVLEFLKFIKSDLIDAHLPWSDSERELAGYISNNDLEVIHRIIKYLYLNKDNINRVNKAVCDVMKYVKNNLLDSFLKTSNVDLRMREISEKHNEAFNQHLGVDIVKDGNSWKVIVPCKPESKAFLVTQDKTNCKCPFLCSACSVCIHRYSCSCTDSCLNWNMCVHVHLVCCFLNRLKNSNAVSDGVKFSADSTVSNFMANDKESSVDVSCRARVAPIHNNSEDANTPGANNTIIIQGSHSQNLERECSTESVDIVSEINDSLNHTLSSGDNNQFSNIDNFIETLDKKKSNLSKKIFTLLNYVENVESVEMIDSIEKLFIPIESYLVTLE